MRKMLIVDDEETIRWALGELFMQEGWEVHGAADGTEAARMVAHTAYDYMITDMKMPGRPGIEVVREARRHNPRMGVTILTGYASVETAVEAVRLGAWDYVTKPCSAAALKARIDEFIEQVGGCGRRTPAAAPLADEELHAFLSGEGTQVLCADALPDRDGPGPLLDALRRMFRDLGFGPTRTRELTQSCVEAVAALSGGRGVGAARAALMEGRVLVGVSGPGEPPAELPETLRSEFDVQARLVRRDGECTVVLSEAM